MYFIINNIDVIVLLYVCVCYVCGSLLQKFIPLLALILYLYR